jgi:hypothetical protein
MQAAQNVVAYQSSNGWGSMFRIEVTARPSADAPAASLQKLKAIVDEELGKLGWLPGCARGSTGAQSNGSLLLQPHGTRRRLGGKADQLNAYRVNAGNPDWFAEDLGRYMTLQPTDVRPRSYAGWCRIEESS